MVKDAAGLWQVTLGPLEPEIYEYSFSVDGYQTLDPGNSWVKPMRSPRTSVFEVPGQPPLVHEFNPAVPHGVVHEHLYQSKSLGLRRSLHVYTPPGYDGSRTKCPVLYLLHGSGDNDATWTAVGRAQLILDNLIAQKKAMPMIVVMTDGHAAFAQSAGNPVAGARQADAFESDLLGDVMPFVETNYRTINKRESRAIVGVSMGGGQSLTVGLNHLDLFAWVGGMSPATPSAEAIASALADPKATNRKLKTLWIGIGKSDFLMKRNQQFDALLTSKDITHTLWTTEGVHGWLVFRRLLVEFAPRLFKS
jgi:enterochelin esterase-like enzyme